MATEENNQQPTVDETPISPIRPNQQRRNSLEQHLKHRPERSELVEKNILPSSTAAPGLLEKQKELDRHMRQDSLNEKLSHRPSPEKLMQDGILNEDPRSPEEKYKEAIEEEYAKREGGA